MSWNYRVVQENNAYTIREVYYDDNGQPHAWSSTGSLAYGENAAELAQDVELMVQAATKPALCVQLGEGHLILVEDTAEVSTTMSARRCSHSP